MRVNYCCDHEAHARYYSQQAGNGLPVFAGAAFQRGHGLGSLFGGLARMAMPLLKSGAKTLGREALKAGMHVAGDVMAGQNVKSSLKRHAKQAAKQSLNRVVQRNKPIKRAAPTLRPVSRTSATKRRRTNDIF